MNKRTKQLADWIFLKLLSVVVDSHSVVPAEAWVSVSLLKQAISPLIWLYYWKKLAQWKKTLSVQEHSAQALHWYLCHIHLKHTDGSGCISAMCCHLVVIPKAS